MLIPPYVNSSNLDAVINKLEESTNNLLQWFRNNDMKANADKWHLKVTGNYAVSVNISESKIESSKKEKFLDKSSDTKLSFEHYNTSCFLLSLKFWSARGASRHPTIMGNCQTIGHRSHSPT